MKREPISSDAHAIARNVAYVRALSHLTYFTIASLPLFVSTFFCFRSFPHFPPLLNDVLIARGEVSFVTGHEAAIDRCTLVLLVCSKASTEVMPAVQ